MPEPVVRRLAWSLAVIRLGDLSATVEYGGVEMTRNSSKVNGAIEKKQTRIRAH
jgi:hypothetical protein